MQKKIAMKFPKRFLWGASTSAHQVEGNQHNQWTVWELENAKARAAQASYQLGELASWHDIAVEAKRPETYVSGNSTGHFKNYEEDFIFNPSPISIYTARGGAGFHSGKKKYAQRTDD